MTQVSASRLCRYALTALSCAAIIFSLAPAPAWAQTSSELSNAQLLRMIRQRTPERLIIIAIRDSSSKLDASPDALLRLKRAGASQAVIGAVIDKSEGRLVQVPESDAPQPKVLLPPEKQSDSEKSSQAELQRQRAEDQMQSADVPDYPDGPGVFYKGPKGWQQLGETDTSGMRRKGMAASIITNGIAPVKQIEIFPGAHASVQINEAKPTFYFIDILDTPPRDIAIISFTVNKGDREVQIGAAGALKHTLQYRPEDIHEVNVSNPSRDIVAVTPREPLPSGEYMIGLAHTPSQNGFEFGISGPQTQAAAEKKK